MPANTPGRAYPYPIGTDPIDTAGDIERLAKAIDTGAPATVRADGTPAPPLTGALLGHAWGGAVVNTLDGLPRGVVSRASKLVDQGGFGGGNIETGIVLSVPNVASRLHWVTFNLRTTQQVAPSPNSVFHVNLQQGSAAGVIVETCVYAWVDNNSQYGRSLIGHFQPTGLVPGANYVLCTGGDGVGRFSILAGSWGALMDVT